MPTHLPGLNLLSASHIDLLEKYVLRHTPLVGEDDAHLGMQTDKQGQCIFFLMFFPLTSSTKQRMKKHFTVAHNI